MRQPLLLESHEGRQRRKVKKLVKRRGPEAQVNVFNEEEDSTKILRMTYLEVSYFKRIVVVPLLSIITGLFFLLFLYWYPNLRKRFLYNPQENVYKATHLFIEGTMNNMEVVDLENKNAEIASFPQTTEAMRHQYAINPFLTFVYRFIRYQYDNQKDKWDPIIFNSKLPFQ
jgi:hypothetical protein